MTNKQIDQFNEMLSALRCIAGHKKERTTFMTPAQIRKSKETEFLGYEDVLEMSYENIQAFAGDVIKRIKPITVNLETIRQLQEIPQPPLTSDSPGGPS
jgi:hypothetical protein